MKGLASLAPSASLLLQVTSAQYYLKPNAIPRLTLSTNFTLHTLCDTLQNPDPFFDESNLQEIVFAYTNDLSLYLRGAWSGASTTAEKDDNPGNPGSYRNPIYGPNSGSSRTQAILQAGEELDCAAFQVNLVKDMAYAISEKCYRQCNPYGTSYRAVAQLRYVFERSTYGSFYQQVRMIEEDKNCSFEDTFLVEPERAVDRVQLWLRDFKSLRSPCADLADSTHYEDEGIPAAHPQHAQSPSTTPRPTDQSRGF